MDKEQRNTTGLNLIIPKDLSIKIDRTLIDLKEEGHKVSKAEFILNCVELAMDDNGLSVPIDNNK